MPTDDVEFPGEELLLGRRRFIVPALSFHSYRKLRSRILQWESLPDEERNDLTIEITHEALVRNYPELEVEEVARLIDYENYRRVFDTVLVASKFVRVEPGKTPAGTTPSSTSTSSSPGSAATPDGTGITSSAESISPAPTT